MNVPELTVLVVFMETDKSRIIISLVMVVVSMGSQAPSLLMIIISRELDSVKASLMVQGNVEELSFLFFFVEAEIGGMIVSLVFVKISVSSQMPAFLTIVIIPETDSPVVPFLFKLPGLAFLVILVDENIARMVVSLITIIVLVSCEPPSLLMVTISTQCDVSFKLVVMV